MSELRVDVGSSISQRLIQYFTSRNEDDMIVTASLPSAGSAVQTQLYRLTTDNRLYYSDGSRWYSQGYGQPTINPIIADFSWLNQGSSTIGYVNGGALLSIPASGSLAFRGMDKAAPATPYSIIAGLLLNFLGVNTTDTLGLYFSDGTKLHTFGVGFSADYYILSGKFNTTTSYSANYTAPPYATFGPLVWLKIQDDGTNRICSISADGKENWITLHSVGRTDFLTATRVGFGGSVTNSSNPASILVVSWEQF